MDLRADLRFARHNVDDALAHVGRVRRGESDASDPLHTCRSAQQVGEIEIAVTVRVHGLTEKHYLSKPGTRRLLDLLEEKDKRQTALAAAYVGHDAERAEL